MSRRPAWIEMLFKRGHGLNAFDIRFLHDFHRSLVEESVGDDPRRKKQLRSAALAAIRSDAPETIIQGLAFLLVVGIPDDVRTTEPLTEHQNEEVREAAKTCCFELRRRSRSAARSGRDGGGVRDERGDEQGQA